MSVQTKEDITHTVNICLFVIAFYGFGYTLTVPLPTYEAITIVNKSFGLFLLSNELFNFHNGVLTHA